MVKKDNLPTLKPDLQVSFYHRILSVEHSMLREALRDTIRQLNVTIIDEELSALVSADALAQFSSLGLRGELLFPVPCVIETTPTLIGYYRLLLGFSRKEFYDKGPFGRFQSLEDGLIRESIRPKISDLCSSLIGSAAHLLEGVTDLSSDTIRDLQMLTLGAQFRGSENNRIGASAVGDVRTLFESILGKHVTEATKTTLMIKNSAGRRVLIQFGADPDVHATESLGEGVRSLLSIEVKGGQDRSNIHNRLGEAEKSHLKAKRQGCTELWTVINVELDEATAMERSPTTTKLFQLDQITNTRTKSYRQFREQLLSRLGLPT